MFDQLLVIKRLKEISAQNLVHKKKHHAENTAHQLKEAEKQLSDYIAWREGEEYRLFNYYQKKMASLTELESFNQKVGLLRNKDVQLEQAISQTRLKYQEAKKALEEANKLHQQAIKAVEKYKMLATQQQQTLSEAVQYREEQENEEFSTLRRTL